MLGYVLIVAFTVLHLGESIFVRNYAKRYGSGGMLMNAIIALFAALFFLVTDKNGFHAPVEMLPLALINAVLYAAGFYFTFLGFRCGPYGLTCLFSGFSLLFPIVYGILFLNEDPGILSYIGMAVILVASVLINLKRGNGEEEGTGKVTLGWLVCVLISMVANGFIAILTRMQQIRFDNACSNEFQFLSIFGSCILLAVIGLILDRKNLSFILRKGTPWGLAAGLCNGGKNLLNLIVYTLLPLSVASPMKTGFSIIATFALAFFFYKEKYTKQQTVGVCLGVGAVILLAI